MRGGVGEGWWRGEGEDGDELGLGVVREADVGSRRDVEEVGGRRAYDEDCC